MAAVTEMALSSPFINPQPHQPTHLPPARPPGLVPLPPAAPALSPALLRSPAAETTGLASTSRAAATSAVAPARRTPPGPSRPGNLVCLDDEKGALHGLLPFLARKRTQKGAVLWQRRVQSPRG